MVCGGKQLEKITKFKYCLIVTVESGQNGYSTVHFLRLVVYDQNTPGGDFTV